MKYEAIYFIDEDSPKHTYIFDATDWYDAMKKAVLKQGAIGMPMKMISREKED